MTLVCNVLGCMRGARWRRLLPMPCGEPVVLCNEHLKRLLVEVPKEAILYRFIWESQPWRAGCPKLSNVSMVLSREQ